MNLPTLPALPRTPPHTRKCDPAHAAARRDAMQTLAHLRSLSLLCTMVVWARPRLPFRVRHARRRGVRKTDEHTCGTPARLVARQARRACAGLKLPSLTSVRKCVKNSRFCSAHSNSRFCSAHYGHMRHCTCSLTSRARTQIPLLASNEGISNGFKITSLNASSFKLPASTRCIDPLGKM